jgi:predicted nucleic-acid-binding protein
MGPAIPLSSDSHGNRGRPFDAVRAAGVTITSAEAVANALSAFARQGDFADHLHLALAAEQGATAFVTFGRTVVASSGSGPTVEVIG